MHEQQLTDELMDIQKDQILTRILLTKFADNPKFLSKQVQRYGKVVFQKCVFSMTHKTFAIDEAETLWENIVKHRIELNGLLKRDVGLQVAAHDYLENIRKITFRMTSIEEVKIDDIVQIATTDKLTGLYMRDIFEVVLEKEFQIYKNDLMPLSLLMLDIDNFKGFNDKHGHQAGDHALENVGKIILGIIRKSDIACRYGGEELAIIMPNTVRDSAYEVAERIRKKIEKSRFENLSITVSIGIAQTSNGIDTPERLLKLADEALYQAKEAGRNQVVSAE